MHESNRGIEEMMISAGEHWSIPFLDFVDAFRRTKDVHALADPITIDNPKYATLVAATIAYLCDEMHLEAPAWVREVSALDWPWFVSGLQSTPFRKLVILKCPGRFRKWNIFVLENFLSRV
jgi:hypothetical protein